MATSFNTKHSYTRGLSALSETIHVYLFSGIPSSSDTSAYLSGSEAVGKAFQANAFQNNTFQTISKSLAVTSTCAYLMLRTPVDTNANIPAYMLGGITSSTTAYMLGMPQPIDVGPEATNRTAYGTGGYTHLDLTTPANVRGTIDTVTIFVNSQMSGVKVGIFYFVSGTTYKCRSATTLGTVPVGLNTYNGLSLGVYPGDFIGIYWSNGNLERDDTGGSNRYYTGDAVNVDAQTNFSGSGTRILSIHGSGYAGYYDEQSNTPIYLYGNLLGRGSTPIYTCGFGTEARSSVKVYATVPDHLDVDSSNHSYMCGEYQRTYAHAFTIMKKPAETIEWVHDSTQVYQDVTADWGNEYFTWYEPICLYQSNKTGRVGFYIVARKYYNTLFSSSRFHLGNLIYVYTTVDGLVNRTYRSQLSKTSTVQGGAPFWSTVSDDGNIGVYSGTGNSNTNSLYVSTDGLQTFSLKSSVLVRESVKLSGDGTLLFAIISGQLNISSNFSTDCDWTSTGRKCSQFDVSYDGSVIIVYYNGTVSLSTDTGETWDTITGSLPTLTNVAVSRDGANLLAYGSYTIWYSTDHGELWEKVWETGTAYTATKIYGDCLDFNELIISSLYTKSWDRGTTFNDISGSIAETLSNVTSSDNIKKYWGESYTEYEVWDDYIGVYAHPRTYDYYIGTEAIKSSASAYLFCGMQSSSSVSAYLNADINPNSNTSAYLCGIANSSSSVSAYTYSGTNTLDSAHSFMYGYSIIDVGPAATNKPSLVNHNNAYKTWIDLNYPANDTGTITSISIYVNSAMTSVKVGLFSPIPDYGYICNSVVDFGNPDAGLQTINGLSLPITAGDYIGISWYSGSLEAGTNGLEKGKEGDYCVVDLETYSWTYGGWDLSIHATGHTPLFTDTITHVKAYLNGCVAPISSVHAYLSGPQGVDVTSHISNYLHGQINTVSLILSYIHGKDNSITNIASYLFGYGFIRSFSYAYLEGTSTYRTSIPIYLTTNTSSVSAQSVFVAGLTQTVNSLINAYISGIIKTQTHCYLSGQMTTTDYITLKTSDNGITKSKKFKVLTESYEELIRTKNENINKTIGGGIDHSIGENSTTWRMVIRVKANEPNPDYGNLSDLEYFYSLNNPNASPNNDIIFTDHHQYEYIVHVIGQFKKNILTTAIEGQQALYFCSLEVLKV